jgi:ELWxxDGT repeat protein
MCHFAANSQYFEKHEVYSGNFIEPRSFHVLDGNLYYLGNDQDEEVERALFKTNGLIENIEKIRDDNQNTLDCLDILGAAQGLLYLYARIDDEPFQVWYTDGTSEGTQLLSQIYEPDFPAEGTATNTLNEINGVVLFNVVGSNGGIPSNEIWKTDGTESGTSILLEINSEGYGLSSDLIKMGDYIYFIGNDGSSGFELWKTDGTSAGTVIVKDINPNGNGASLSHWVIFQNELYFQGDDGTLGKELWKTDGTEEGTILVKDINPGDSDGFITFPNIRMIRYNNSILFMAQDGDSGMELWSTDGTEQGTELVIDLNTGSGSSFPKNFAEFDGKVYFNAQDGTGTRLWATNGTANGTIQIAADEEINNPRQFFVVDGELVFRNIIGVSTELWRTDGTNSGTYQISPEIYDEEWSLQSFGDFALFGERLFLEAKLNDTSDLWSYGATDLFLSTSDFENTIELKIFPNPAKEMIWIQSEEPLEMLRIYNLEGRLIRSSALNGLKEVPVLISDLPAGGTYLLELTSGDKAAVKKVILQK